MFSCIKGKQKDFYADTEYTHEKSDIAPFTLKPCTPTDTTERLRELREAIADVKIDYYIIPSGDAHGSEYVAKDDRRQGFISGFSGESSTAIVSQTSACLFVDGRYHVSAGKEIDQNWHLYKVGVEGVPTWTEYLKKLPSGTRVGLNATLFGVSEVQNLLQTLSKTKQELVFVEDYLVDKVWHDRPARSKEFVTSHTKYAGESSYSKLEKLRQYTKNGQAEAYVLQELSEIAWLLNLRGKDIPFSPVFFAYLLVTSEDATLFVDRDKIVGEVLNYLQQDLRVSVRPYEEVWSALKSCSDRKIPCMMSKTGSYAIFNILGKEDVQLVKSPVELAKSIKNDVEIRGMKAAYLLDAVAWVQWIAWLEKKMSKGTDSSFTEWHAAEHLSRLRAGQPLFAGLAYENISATGANAALPHYSTGKGTAAILRAEDVYLNDSGAQYLDGTIDTTRTYHFGRPKPEHKRAYTRVLQGHVQAARAKFPAGTTGAAIDSLARAPLWQDGMNFLHGTGHGIGHYLNVHEGPQRIASYNNEPLRAGQFVSIEPGFYEEGYYGIRIESIFLVKQVDTMRNFGGKWLEFERITQIPIDTALVDWKLLNKEETAWLKEHNKACAKTLLPLIPAKDRRTKSYLKRNLWA